MGNPNDNMPAELTRRYEVVIKPQSKQKALKLREINADHIGRLVTVQVGIIAKGNPIVSMLESCLCLHSCGLPVEEC